jgi:hypothetical protein
MTTPTNRLPVAYNGSEPTYTDTGCSLAPSCLNCPFAACIEDYPRMAQKYHQAVRDWAKMQWLEANPCLSVVEVAEAWSVTERTVFRVRARWRSTSGALINTLGNPQHGI